MRVKKCGGARFVTCDLNLTAAILLWFSCVRTGAGHIFYPDASEEWTEVFNVKTLGRRALSMIPLPAQLSEREFSSSIVAHRLVGANAADPAWVIVFYDNGCLDCDQVSDGRA